MMKTMILNGSPRRNWNTVFFGREPEQKKAPPPCPAAGFLYSSGVDVYRTIPKLIPEYSSGIPAQSSTNPLRYET
jgi:hypothetical protein